MRIERSAHRHGVPEDDIAHAWTQALRLVEFEYDGEERLLVIGPRNDGQLLELVAALGEGPPRIIHADLLRRRFYGYLR